MSAGIAIGFFTSAAAGILAALLRAGGGDREVADALLAAVAAKGPGGCLDLNQFYRDRLPRKMWQIGG